MEFIFRYRGTIYLCAYETPEKLAQRENETEVQKKMCSWGYKFEHFMTEGVLPSYTAESYYVSVTSRCKCYFLFMCLFHYTLLSLIVNWANSNIVVVPVTLQKQSISEVLLLNLYSNNSQYQSLIFFFQNLSLKFVRKKFSVPHKLGSSEFLDA